MNQQQPRTALEWLDDFQDCVIGTHGPEWRERADEWIEANHSLPEGQGWRAWRELRQAVSA